MSATTVELEVAGRVLRLTNLDKTFWPEARFTKGDVVDYYTRVAPALLPHIAGRPVTLHRFPDGVDGWNWYQLQWPRGHPSWLRAQPLVTRTGGVLQLCLIDDLASLLWAANLAAIELHPFLARGERPDEPTVVVFDLDPGPPADIVDCCRVAVWIRDALNAAGLASCVKTSGSVGLHVYVPLNRAHTYGETKAFARALARELAHRHGERVTDQAKKSLRAGKVLVDWLQNDPMRSTAAPYSLRGAGWPTVSTPVTWEEVEQALATRRPELLTFEPSDVLARLDCFGDLFRPVLERRQSLPG